MNEQIKDVNPNAEEITNLEAQIAGIDVTTLDPFDNGKVKQNDEPQTTEAQAEVQDPIKEELDRVKGQTQGKSPKEKFEYKLQRELAQAKEMGIDIATLAGIKNETPGEDPEKPLTRKDLEDALRGVKPQSKSALEMAMDIENEAERELHLHYLENKVNPVLSEEDKFQTVKDMVNAIKLRNHVQLSEIKPNTQTHSTANSVQPIKQANFDNNRLTPEEEMLFRDAQARGIPFTKEEIIATRKK